MIIPTFYMYAIAVGEWRTTPPCPHHAAKPSQTPPERTASSPQDTPSYIQYNIHQPQLKRKINIVKSDPWGLAAFYTLAAVMPTQFSESFLFPAIQFVKNCCLI